jgi:hypothetical protein
LYWQAGETKPWYLATNLLDARSAVRLYRRRRWIEEMFGDLKNMVLIWKPAIYAISCACLGSPSPFVCSICGSQLSLNRCVAAVCWRWWIGLVAAISVSFAWVGISWSAV